MIVLTPIAFIRLKKLWFTGTEESTASTRESLRQKSAALAEPAESAQPAINRMNALTGLSAEDLRFPSGVSGIP